MSSLDDEASSSLDDDDAEVGVSSSQGDEEPSPSVSSPMDMMSGSGTDEGSSPNIVEVGSGKGYIIGG